MVNIFESCKNIIDVQLKDGKVKSFGIPFDNVQKAYFWTNENIDAYLKVSEFSSSDKAATVTASGDHPFSLITNGVLNIDTFDTNNFAEFFAFGLKRALILKYNYKDFINVINKIINPEISLDELSAILIDALPFMEQKYRKFWRDLINYNYIQQNKCDHPLNLFHLLCISISKFGNDSFCISYLINEENYNILKTNLQEANVAFYNVDAINLGEQLSDKYNFILLSNILDYFYKKWGYNWNYETLKNYLNSLEKITESGSVIYLNYIMRYATSNFTTSKLFKDSNVTKGDLTDEEVIKFVNPSCSCFDGMVIKRVK